MRIVELPAGLSSLIVSSAVHRTIPMKDSAKTRTKMVSLQALRKRDCKIRFIGIPSWLTKSFLKGAPCVGQPWQYELKTDPSRYRLSQ